MEDIAVYKYDKGLEIELSGSLNLHNMDLLSNEFRITLEKNPEMKIFGINCINLKSIDSSGFGMLISLARQSEKNGIDFYICELNTHVTALFDMAHLDKFFRIVGLNEFRRIAQS